MEYIVVCVILIALIALWFWMVAKMRVKYRDIRYQSSVVLKLSIPQNNELLPDAAEQVFSGLTQIYVGPTFIDKVRGYFQGQPTISFEIVGLAQSIAMYIHVPKYLQGSVENQIYGSYPVANVTVEKDYLHDFFAPGSTAVFSELVKEKSSALPLKTYRDAVKGETGINQLKEVTVDMLNAITNAMLNLQKGESLALQIVIQPTHHNWHKGGTRYLNKLYAKTRTKQSTGETEKLSIADDMLIHDVDQSQKKDGFYTALRIVASSPSSERANMLNHGLYSAVTQINTQVLNKLIPKRHLSYQELFTSFAFRQMPIFPLDVRFDLPFYNKISVLTVAELATLYHLPNKNIQTPYMNFTQAKLAAIPANVPATFPPEGGVLLGFNRYRGVKTPVYMARDDRRRHIYCIGKTGMGKSTLALNMIYQDIMNGEGCCYIDPHGDAIEEILTFIPKERIDDVVLFDAGDMEFPVGLNLLDFERPDQRNFVVDEFVNILNKLYPNFIDPMFEHYVRNCLLTITYNPKGGTLVEMMRILTDAAYKDDSLQYVTNPMVKAFWKEEIGQTVEFHMSEILGPILSKFGRFVSNSLMRNIIGQTKSTIHLRPIMDSQKILLIKLAKGVVGDINCSLLGMIFVTKILMASLERVDIPEAERRDFYLYVDEFQNFASETFMTILSEARKYRLNLYMTHQYLGQLVLEKKESTRQDSHEEKDKNAKEAKVKMQNAIFGNVGTMLFMRVGAPDAEIIAKELKPTFDETDVINVDKFTLYGKVLVDGVATKPFSIQTYPPYAGKDNFSKEIIEASRKKYGMPREEVEKQIYERGNFADIGGRPLVQPEEQEHPTSDFGAGNKK